MDTAPSPLLQVWEKGRNKLLPPEQLIEPVLFPEVMWGHKELWITSIILNKIIIMINDKVR